MGSGVKHSTTVSGGTVGQPADWNAEHTITYKDFLKALFEHPSLNTGLVKAWPLNFDDTKVTYDGEWLKMVETGTSYPAITIGHSIQKKGTLIVHATVKAPDDTSRIYYLFMEPYKGNFDNYQGMDTRGGSTYYARSRNAASETATALSGEDWSTETNLKITHDYDQSDVYFYVDDVEKAHHTTNISAQPYEVCCCEPDGVARTIYLKYPPGIKVGAA